MYCLIAQLRSNRIAAYLLQEIFDNLQATPIMTGDEEEYYPVYARNGDDLKALDVRGNALIEDLRMRVVEAFKIIDFELSLGDNHLRDKTSLADAGVCNEAEVQITPTILHWESLYETFGSMVVPYSEETDDIASEDTDGIASEDRDYIEWYYLGDCCKRAKSEMMLARGPISSDDYNQYRLHCSNEKYCGTYGMPQDNLLVCNEKNEITKMNFDYQHRFGLHGHLSLNMIPNTVEEMDFEGQQISSVDFRGLSNNKSLFELNLNGNQITRVDFKQLHGTKLRNLLLNRNLITDITFQNAKKCDLRTLHLGSNPIKTINFIGIQHIGLDNLYIGSRPSVLERVEGFSDLKRAQCGPAYKYLLAYDGSVDGISEFVPFEDFEPQWEPWMYDTPVSRVLSSPNTEQGDLQKIEDKELPMDMTMILSWILISIAAFLVLMTISISICCYYRERRYLARQAALSFASLQRVHMQSSEGQSD